MAPVKIGGFLLGDWMLLSAPVLATLIYILVSKNQTNFSNVAKCQISLSTTCILPTMTILYRCLLVSHTWILTLQLQNRSQLLHSKSC